MPEDISAGGVLRVADRLAQARRARFVGRATEIDQFYTAVRMDEPPFVVLHVHGPGGIGKSSLLREYARVAAECGRTAVHLDGRDFEPSPAGFSAALQHALGAEASDLASLVLAWPPGTVLFVDTCEALSPLDRWLREMFLPRLPAHSLVVFAGRNTPAPAWRTDIDWAHLTRIIALRGLNAEESRLFLAVRGVSQDRQSEALALTHGHPLALSLAADVINQSPGRVALNALAEPDVVRELLERFVQHVPDQSHRQALAICALALSTTEGLLAEMLGLEAAQTCFEWLRGLPFIEQGPYGLFPHDLAREVLAADLRWRDPDSHRQLSERLYEYFKARLEPIGGAKRKRLQLEWFFTLRFLPWMRPYFDWNAIDSAYAEPATASDAPAIVAMVRAHEGEASARIVAHWLNRQPQAFLAFRNTEAQLVGFMTQLALHEASFADIAVDPAASTVWLFARRHGPLRAGDGVSLLRFWMHRDKYQAITAAINLAAMNCVEYWMAHPRLAWSFTAMSDADSWLPHFAPLNFQRAPEADFEIGERRFGVFAHDWRVEPISVWPLARRTQIGRGVQPAATVAEPLLPVLSQPEFAEAVRQALRTYTRPDELAGNPLLRARVAHEAAGSGASPATLQQLLREAAASLGANPKDEKLRRALWHTYFEPEATQERAAEFLDLPFSTYRYHLSQGIERVTAWLWQRELYGIQG